MPAAGCIGRAVRRMLGGRTVLGDRLRRRVCSARGWRLSVRQQAKRPQARVVPALVEVPQAAAERPRGIADQVGVLDPEEPVGADERLRLCARSERPLPERASRRLRQLGAAAFVGGGELRNDVRGVPVHVDQVQLGEDPGGCGQPRQGIQAGRDPVPPRPEDVPPGDLLREGAHDARSRGLGLRAVRGSVSGGDALADVLPQEGEHLLVERAQRGRERFGRRRAEHGLDRRVLREAPRQRGRAGERRADDEHGGCGRRSRARPAVPAGTQSRAGLRRAHALLRPAVREVTPSSSRIRSITRSASKYSRAISLAAREWRR